MTSETELVISLWESVRDVIPAGKRTEVAEDLLRAVQEYGFEATDVASVAEEDDDLADAYDAVYGEDVEEEEEV